VGEIAVLANNWRQLGRIIALMGLCIIFLVGCRYQSTTTTRSDRISIGTTLQVRTLDPADAYELASSMVIYNTGDRLYTYATDSTELVPQLATALPTVSDDGLTYTIPLRQNVTFHDGTPFNADAMAFSLQRFIDNKGKPSFLLSDVVDSVEASGDYELTIRLKQPFAAFSALLTYPGLCAISPEAYQIEEGQFAPNIFVGTGPYTLGEFGNDALRLEPFDNYWGDPPVNGGIDIQRFSSKANLYNAFSTAAMDVAYQSLDPDQIRSLEERASENGWNVVTAEGTIISYMVLNLQQPPLDRLAVRQAIAAAVDRQLLDDRVFYGQAQPLYSLIPSSFDVYEDAFRQRYGDLDAEDIKAQLREAGFSRDNPLTVEIWYPSGSAQRRLASIVFKADAQRKFDGLLQFEPHGVEATTAFGYLDKGVYPTFMLDWYADFFDADNYIQPFLSCSEGSADRGCIQGASQYQGAFYYSDRANQLIDRERKTRDPEVRTQIFSELQQLVAQDVPYIPLWQNQDYAFAQRGITGVQLSSTQQLLPFWTISRSNRAESAVP
jgi:peptide/nickel transport system substrate-binding protein